jgi:hypothetical protein
MIDLDFKIFEVFYRRINHYKGPDASPEAHAEIRMFWNNSGREGVQFLVDKLVDETHLELIEGVMNHLADIGPPSIRPIMEVLTSGRSRYNTECFLKTLGYIGSERGTDGVPPRDLAELIMKFFDHDFCDVREAAAMATQILPDKHALDLLYNFIALEFSRC